MIGGLKAPELNGKIAVVFGFDESSGRYVIELETGFGGQKAVRPENLTARGSATGVVAARARAASAMKASAENVPQSRSCSSADASKASAVGVAARDKKFDALDADLHVQLEEIEDPAEGPMARLPTMHAGLGLRYGSGKGYGPCGDKKSSRIRKDKT